MPVNNSASSSELILLSKLKSASAVEAMLLNSRPNNLALVTASAINSGLAPRLALTCPVTLPVASNISLLFKAIPVERCNA